jgi:hypothetical protein
MYSSHLPTILLLSVLVPFKAEAFQQLTPRCMQLAKIQPATMMLSSHARDDENGDHVRRKFLLVSTGLAFFMQGSSPALAKYGDSSNMDLPNYIDYLIEKQESADQEKKKVALYKGADPTVLLKRLQEANKRLGNIPTLAEEKKWSQVQGTLTGPLGTLGQTINQIATPDSSAKVKDASKKVKSDVIAIDQAAQKKNSAACAEMARLASKDLEIFVKLAFEI